MVRMRYEDGLAIGDCRIGARAKIERMQRRSSVLRKQDRRLLEMVLVYGMSFYRIGEMTGVSPRRVAVRFRRVRELLTADETVRVYEKLCSRNRLAGEMYYDKVVNGRGYRQLARKYGVSEYRVRKMMKLSEERQMA